MPELMPWFGNVRKLTAMVLEVMNDLGWLCEVRKELVGLVEKLRPPGGKTASMNAAELVAELLANRKKSR